MLGEGGFHPHRLLITEADLSGLIRTPEVHGGLWKEARGDDCQL